MEWVCFCGLLIITSVLKVKGHWLEAHGSKSFSLRNKDTHEASKSLVEGSPFDHLSSPSLSCSPIWHHL